MLSMTARTFLYATILVLAVFVLIATFVLGNGGGSSSEAEMTVSIHDLATFTDQYRGERVTTEGVLRRYDEPSEHFVVEDGGLRVAISSAASEALRPLEGRRVTVTGRFDVELGTGRYIEVERVTPAR